MYLFQQDFGLNKFRVAFVSPEMAIGKSFHEHVLKAAPFQDNNIGLIIDELHTVDEWGTDDFRAAYAQLSVLLQRMPTGAPIMMGTATLPPLLRTSIVHKLGVAGRYEHLAYSNAKPNIAISVRILQHKLASYADLLPLFTTDADGVVHFPQTLIYVNSRKEAEEIQDFLRRHCPDSLSSVTFEFYHRYISEEQKLGIQEQLRDGMLLGVPTTDALGLVSSNLILAQLLKYLRAWTSGTSCASFCGASHEHSCRSCRRPGAVSAS
jgi:superfamily II DNA helicase RecQ